MLLCTEDNIRYSIKISHLMTVKRTKTAFTRLLIWSGKTELLKWITNRQG
jgi:hypothetical protein